MKNARDSVRDKMLQYRKRPDEILGWLGNLATNVINKPDTQYMVYVTLLNGGVIEALNTRVPNYIGTQVWVGRDPEYPGVTQVLRACSIYPGEMLAMGVPFHPRDHEWPHAGAPFIKGEQFYPSLFHPVPGELKVKIYPGTYEISVGIKIVDVVTIIDLSAYLPSADGLARWTVIAVDNSGMFVVRAGAEITGFSNLADTNFPVATAGDNSICGVKMFFGQTEFRKNGDNNDFRDLRFAGGMNSAGSSAHLKQHGIVSSADHTSAATEGRMLKADANGLPVEATNTDTQVSGAISASHTQAHAITSTSDHTSAATAGYLLKADANGLPVTASNTDAEIAAVASQRQFFPISEDLSSQISGSTAHFTTSLTMFSFPAVYCNLRQLPTDITLDADAKGFTLSYTPSSSDKLIVDYVTTLDHLVNFDGLPIIFNHGYILWSA